MPCLDEEETIETCIKKYGEENIIVVSAEIENQINDLANIYKDLIINP